MLILVEVPFSFYGLLRRHHPYNKPKKSLNRSMDSCLLQAEFNVTDAFFQKVTVTRAYVYVSTVIIEKAIASELKCPLQIPVNVPCTSQHVHVNS